MKKILLLFFTIAFFASALGGCSCQADNTDSNAGENVVGSDSNLDDSGENNDNDDGGEDAMLDDGGAEENPNEFAIRYVGIDFETGKEMSIPNGMWKVSGKYPERYTLGEAVSIDFLQNYTNGGVEYEFYGYFSDQQCTVPFGGITETTTGEVIVYAQIKDDVTIYV